MYEEPQRDIVVYTAGDQEFRLPLDRERDTVWASQAQIVQLFGVDVSGVSRHIRKIFADQEINPESNLQKVQIASSDRPVTLYSLDVILAVGYRANSRRAIAFRRWASSVLKDYMLEGAALNERRLEQLGSIVRVLSRSTDELVAGVADVLTSYLPSLRSLRDYDEGTIEPPPGGVASWVLDYDEARSVINQVGVEFPEDRLFGHERGDGLKSVVDALYQGFGGQQLYPTVQEQAANLLYLVVKDHPLSDGCPDHIRSGHPVLHHRASSAPPRQPALAIRSSGARRAALETAECHTEVSAANSSSLRSARNANARPVHHDTVMAGSCSPS